MKVHVEHLTSAYSYVSRGDWFVEGTTADLLNNLGHCGLFKGHRVADNDNEIRVCGSEERVDEELCQWDEFDIYDPDGNEVEILWS